MKVSIHTKHDYFPKHSSFEEIFNNTHIDQLYFYGSIISPSNSLILQNSFIGLIRSLTVDRHVDIIDAKNYPYYSNVLFYTIHSIGAHSMNLTSFSSSYQNLRGLEIIESRFDISIDQFLPSLDSLTIDVENFNEKTVFAARHISHLKLGSRLRRLDSKVFSSSFFRRLRSLDLSQVDLSQLTSDARCSLIEYLHKTLHQQLNFISPELENPSDCQCAQLFLLHLIYKSTDLHYSTCSRQCQLTDCSLISEYFRSRYPLLINENPLNQISDENQTNENGNLPVIDLDEDSIDDHLFKFLINPTEKY